MNADSEIVKLPTKTLTQIFGDANHNKKFFAPPWLTDSSLNMLFAPTGMGKSHFAFNLGLKLAQGSTWLNEQCLKSKVLYVDGEMGGDTWMKRLMDGMILGCVEENFHMMCPENFKDFSIPTLANRKNHARWIETCKDYDVIVIDNYIACCMPTDSRMSDTEIWLVVKDLLVTLRSMGKAVIIVHHTNKEGSVQHGTYYKEMWMDIIIRLKQFPVQALENGLTWEILYTEDRHDYYGTGYEHLMDIVFAYDQVHTRMKDIDEERNKLITQWLDEGWLDEEIAHKLDIRKGKVQFIKRKFKNQRNDEDII